MGLSDARASRCTRQEKRRAAEFRAEVLSAPGGQWRRSGLVGASRRADRLAFNGLRISPLTSMDRHPGVFLEDSSATRRNRTCALPFIRQGFHLHAGGGCADAAAIRVRRLCRAEDSGKQVVATAPPRLHLCRYRNSLWAMGVGY